MAQVLAVLEFNLFTKDYYGRFQKKYEYFDELGVL